jgi:hypothetical protein
VAASEFLVLSVVDGRCLLEPRWRGHLTPGTATRVDAIGQLEHQGWRVLSTAARKGGGTVAVLSRPS